MLKLRIAITLAKEESNVPIGLRNPYYETWIIVNVPPNDKFQLPQGSLALPLRTRNSSIARGYEILGYYHRGKRIHRSW